jgi:hypothetical protein
VQRLDVDHPVMTTEDGAQVAVPGTWVLLQGGSQYSSCALPTGTGLDVPPGNYQVQTTFVNPETNEPVTTTDEVTLSPSVGVPVTVTKMGAGIGSVTSTPAGLDCGPACTRATATLSGRVVLSATPGLNSRFVGWSGECFGFGSAPTCTFTPTTASLVSAVFAPVNVAVNFVVDDTANRSFRAGELVWKGGFRYDEATREVVKDATWAGPYPLLWDDGPWTAGGHEPRSAIAGDNRWGVTVFVAPPVTGTVQYEYGLAQFPAQWWIWEGVNGVFSVTAAPAGEVDARGMTIRAFGTTDVKVVIDRAALAPRSGGAWDTTRVRVAGSPWMWERLEAVDTGTMGDDVAGDGKFTFVLSVSLAQSRNLGLARSGDTVRLMPVLGGVEYKNPGPQLAGITAFTRVAGGTWQPASLSVRSNDLAFTAP